MHASLNLATNDIQFPICCEFRSQIPNFTPMKFRFVEQVSIATNQLPKVTTSNNNNIDLVYKPSA